MLIRVVKACVPTYSNLLPYDELWSSLLRCVTTPGVINLTRGVLACSRVQVRCARGAMLDWCA